MYDNTKEAEITDVTFKELTENGQSVALTKGSDYRIIGAEFENANANEKGDKKVTYTVELLNENYIFENENMRLSAEAKGKISKAEYPGGSNSSDQDCSHRNCEDGRGSRPNQSHKEHNRSADNRGDRGNRQ